MTRDLIIAIVGSALIVACAAVAIIWATPSNAAWRQCGRASWYGTESGSRTATGAVFTGRAFTAAMPSRSMLGRHVRVTFGKRSVVVLVDDLGPARRLHRIIDLSRAAAVALGIVRQGVAIVCLTG